jgi:hypothetical protein
MGGLVERRGCADGLGTQRCSRYVWRRDHRIPRGKTAELYIADPESKRVQVYGLDGTFRRIVGNEFLNSSSGSTQWGDFLVVAELYSRLAGHAGLAERT